MKINIEQFKSLEELLNYLIDNKLALNKTDARKKTSEIIPKESKFQSDILKYLKTVDNCLAWKAQAGMYQIQGVPDVICIKNGLFIGFEIKRPLIGKASPIQEDFHDKIKRAGGRVFIVSFVSEVKRILEEIDKP